MMKRLTPFFILLLINVLARTAMAQGTDEWSTVTIANAPFTVQMPRSPEVKKQKNRYDALEVDTEVYRAVNKGTTYTLWSLKNLSYTQAQTSDRESYMDDCADLVWESLLEPEREKLPKKPGISARMTYEGAFRSSMFPGREYSITLGILKGVTNFYVEGDQIFVLMVFNPAPDGADAQRFLRSFATKDGSKISPAAIGDSYGSAQGMGTGIGPGEGGFGPGRGSNTGGASGATGAGTTASNSTVDYNRTFSAREVTQKVRLLYRPAPSYTESARKYGVQGTVVVRAVISNTGEMTNVKVVKGLPHGLTAKAVEAARLIRSEPAMKDGHAVAQYILIEYNFNLY